MPWNKKANSTIYLFVLGVECSINDLSDIKGDVSETVVPFDYLVIGVGAENSTFGRGILRVDSVYQPSLTTGNLNTFRYTGSQGTCLLFERNRRCSKDQD